MAVEGGALMRVKNQERWEGLLRENTGVYQRTILEFAGQWADRMEAGLVNGGELENIAERAIAETGKKLTAIQLAQAIIALVEVWEHGEELRRWYKKRLQEMRVREKG